MKFLKIGLSVVILAGLGFVFMAPIGPAPGFFIGGSETTSPASWPDTSGVHEIKLKVDGTLPRVVIIWVIQFGGELYVVGDATSGWVKMIGEGAPVEMRLGDNTYSLNASRVREGWQPILQAYLDKYRPDYPEIVASIGTADQDPSGLGLFKLSR